MPWQARSCGPLKEEVEHWKRIRVYKNNEGMDLT